MPPLYPDPSVARASLRAYKVAHEAHLAALAALVRASDPDQVVTYYRDTIITGAAVREAVLATLGSLGLPFPEDGATVDDLQGLMPDIITITEVGP